MELGKATAQNLLNEGVEVHVVGTNDSKLDAFKSEVGDNLFTHNADITNKEQVNNLISDINGLDNLDYLVKRLPAFLAQKHSWTIPPKIMIPTLI